MCGIGGILRTDGQPIPEEWLDAIDARIAWRGPDGSGRFRDRVEFVDAQGQKRTVEVAFVHRRLSIIDHEGGAQPMVSQRGRNEKEGLVAVVFNGCIYNHRELRQELEGKGHRFVTDHSDTEVLIHGWREWPNSELLEFLCGMYAFALWDRGRRELILARDDFGEKPLYSHYRIPGSTLAKGDLLAFASSFAAMDALRHMTADEPGSHIALTPEYLRLGYVPVQFNEPYRPIEVPACSYDRFSVGRSPYNTCTLDRPYVYPTATTQQVEERLQAAVANRLDADVPVGCFLSGGIDSAMVAGFAGRVRPDIAAFTVRMPDVRYDESTFAAATARHLGLDHHVLDVAVQPADDLIHLTALLGQPFGDSSILPTYWVSKAARQHVKVALSGDGGDELFAGYERYVAAPFLARHWRWLRLLPTSSLHRFHPKRHLNKLARLRDMARDFPTLGLAAMESIFALQEISALTGRSYDCFERVDSGDGPTSALRKFDIDSYLPGDLLRKVDTASMVCGLEVRCPFLDRELAATVYEMPIDQLMPGGQRKGLLRQIARKYLPREIVDRPKMGFAIPIGEWFRTDYGQMKTLLLDHLNSAAPFGPIQLSRKAVQRFIDEHMSGKRDHGQRLFTLLTLSIWAKQQTSKRRNVETSK